MSRKPNDRNDLIGKIAGAVLACVVLTVALGGLALMQTQDAIDEAVAQQQALACFQQPRMCVPVEREK